MFAICAIGAAHYGLGWHMTALTNEDIFMAMRVGRRSDDYCTPTNDSIVPLVVLYRLLLVYDDIENIDRLISASCSRQVTTQVHHLHRDGPHLLYKPHNILRHSAAMHTNCFLLGQVHHRWYVYED